MTIARRLVISGRVQGVFYRGWMVGQARDLGVAGWVRNVRSGAVEALVMGSGEAVDALIARCRRGPPAARVDEIEIEHMAVEPLDGFHQWPTF